MVLSLNEFKKKNGARDRNSLWLHGELLLTPCNLKGLLSNLTFLHISPLKFFWEGQI